MLVRAVNLSPKVGKFTANCGKKHQIHGQNYSNGKETNLSFMCKTTFLLSVTNLSKTLTGDQLKL